MDGLGSSFLRRRTPTPTPLSFFFPREVPQFSRNKRGSLEKGGGELVFSGSLNNSPPSPPPLPLSSSAEATTNGRVDSKVENGHECLNGHTYILYASYSFGMFMRFLICPHVRSVHF